MASRNSKCRMIYWKISYCKQLARCSVFAKLLFTWLIPNTDDLGRMEGEPEILKGMIFPYEKLITAEMVQKALEELNKEHLILWYIVDGDYYIQFPKFDKYQNLRKDRTYKSDYPEPLSDSVTTSHDKSRHDRQKVREVKRSEVKRSEGEVNINSVFDGHNFSDEAEAKITEWLTYKNERKESYKPTGLKNLLSEIKNNINASGEQAVINIISQSMAAGYKGIVWDKLKKLQGKNLSPADQAREIIRKESENDGK